MTPKIRVVLIDDHAILRSGLRMLIDAQDDIEVVGEAADGAEGIEVIAETSPDVAVMDLTMPVMGGIETTRRLSEDFPNIRVVVLTMHDDSAALRAVLEAGGAGYVLKDAADTELLAAIRMVHKGRTHIGVTLSKEGVAQFLSEQKPGSRAKNPATVLSTREREVLREITHGYSNRETAERLLISIKTVETYRSRISEKLGLRHRADLVRYAQEIGLFDSRQ